MDKRSFRGVAPLIGSVALAFALVAPANSQQVARECAELNQCKLTWFSAQGTVESLQATADAFHDKTGITVETFKQVSAPLLERTFADIQRGTPPDIILLTGIPDMLELQKAGHLAAYEPAGVKADFPEGLKGYAPYAYPDSLGGYGLAFNTNAVSAEEAKLLSDWSTAFDPRFAGRIGIPDPNFVGGFVNNLWMLKQNLPAEEYSAMLAALGALKPRTYESTVPMNSALASGDIAVGWSYDGTLSAQISAGAPIQAAFVEPQPIMFTLIGVVEPSGNPEAARLFVDWFTSVEGQNVWAKAYGTLPANPNATDGRPMTKQPWYKAPENLVYLTSIPTQEQRTELLEEFNRLVLGR